MLFYFQLLQILKGMNEDYYNYTVDFSQVLLSTINYRAYLDILNHIYNLFDTWISIKNLNV